MYQEPKVGMGATIIIGSDRNPATIIDVFPNRKTIVIQHDDYKRTDVNGMSECQDYEYYPNTNGFKYVYTLRKNGRWVKKGTNMNDGTSLYIGERNKYYDFSF